MASCLDPISMSLVRFIDSLTNRLESGQPLFVVETRAHSSNDGNHRSDTPLLAEPIYASEARELTEVELPTTTSEGPNTGTSEETEAALARAKEIGQRSVIPAISDRPGYIVPTAQPKNYLTPREVRLIVDYFSRPEKNIVGNKFFLASRSARSEGFTIEKAFAEESPEMVLDRSYVYSALRLLVRVDSMTALHPVILSIEGVGGYESHSPEPLPSAIPSGPVQATTGENVGEMFE